MEDILFRSSSTGHLMGEPILKADKEAGNLSETAKTNLIDIFVRNQYGRQTDITNKYVEKGLMVEEDAITLYSRVKKTFFRKNEDHLKNAFIMGTPDCFLGENINQASHIVDVKSSWDIFTFFRTKYKKMNPLYYWQLQSYMALTGAKTAALAYCLVDTPECFLKDEKRRLLYSMGATEDNELYQEACKALEKQMIYQDIPMKERVIEFEIKRNDEDIKRLYAKIAKAREYLKFIQSEIPNELQLTA